MSFRLFGFPVTISPTFLILGVFLLDSNLGWQGIASWVGAAFASVLIHEMGHAFAVRRAGGLVQGITLHGLGGATAWVDPQRRIGWGQRIGIAAAGAGLGFLVAGALFGLVRAGLFGEAAAAIIDSPFRVFLGEAAATGAWGIFFLAAFIWVTMAWGLINWLPIGGLDGWHILAELLERWLPGRGRNAAAVIGVLVALGAGWFLLQTGLRFGAIILVLFSLQTLIAQRASTRVRDEVRPGSVPPATELPPTEPPNPEG
jgi:Zn-dependent protease